LSMSTIDEHLLAAVQGRRGVGAANRLCEACVVLFSIDAAAISLVFDGSNVGTLGASGVLARKYDELQFTAGEGPCLDAVAHREPVVVVDLADPAEIRWPAYGPAMLTNQIRSVSAMPVTLAGEYVGAMDLFHSIPVVLGNDQLAGLVLAAELAQMPLLDIVGEDLQTALDDPDSDAWAELNALSRVEVSQATGMLMAQLNCEAPQALARLRAHAYASGRSATDVARDVLDRQLRLGD